ncbi:opiorphin prepropeptide isoform X2 [Aotus nancymaae]|uniref:opiorphin prepropeptide isoform X2 n=1 Tax=Aotus nancymaae TaxID=37293 RepID=UPI0006254C77|nr:opiorphin prepropeptide isoform X2 [Aotus nancymaae]
MKLTFLLGLLALTSCFMSVVAKHEGTGDCRKKAQDSPVRVKDSLEDHIYLASCHHLHLTGQDGFHQVPHLPMAQDLIHHFLFSLFEGEFHHLLFLSLAKRSFYLNSFHWNLLDNLDSFRVIQTYISH